jgi:hypothetical protein
MITKEKKYFNNSRRRVLMGANLTAFMAEKLETMTATGGNPAADNRNSTQ